MLMYGTATFLIPPVLHSKCSLQSQQMFGPGSSSTMSFEPGLERGVPWGRDLFTFVTSAAGHMMRTLQRPRKNKPSKRQVNHRRFLHNMIQRKFAEIEAGNHQLCSALCSAETSHRQLDTKSLQRTEPANTMKNAAAESSRTETSPKQQNVISTSDSVVDNPNTRHSKSKAPKTGNNSLQGGKDNLDSGKDSLVGNSGEVLENSREHSPLESTAFNCEREPLQSTPVDLDNLLEVSNIILEDNIVTWLDNIERIQQNSNVHISKCPSEEQEHLSLVALLDISPALPAESPLPLDSCDFEVHLQTDIDHISQMQHITESLQLDVMEDVELLDSTEGDLQIHDNDQVITSAWHMQSEEGQGSFQNSFINTFLNTSHGVSVMDNQSDCGEGLDVGPQLTTFLQNSIKDLNTENDFRDNIDYNPATCRSNCHQSQSVMSRQTGVTIDPYLSNPDNPNTAMNNEGQYTVSDMWSSMGEASQGLEQGNFLNRVLDSQVLQRTDHVLTQYWNQQQIPKVHTPNRDIDPYCVLLHENSSIDSGTTLNPNSVYTSPPNLHSSSAEDFCFGAPPQATSSCGEDSCLYSNGEGDLSVPSFEGVAQSFPAPAHKPHPHRISTPPLNDDWLFSNIVAEETFKSMIKSPGQMYC